MHETEHEKCRPVCEKRRRPRRVMISILLLCVLLLAGYAVLRYFAQQPIPLFQGGDIQTTEPAMPSYTDNWGTEPGGYLGEQSDMLAELEERAKTDTRVESILQRIDAYPVPILELALKNGDAVDFAAAYPEHKDEAVNAGDIDLSGDYGLGTIPLLIQWDSRWGYGAYGSNLMGLAGCGPTCLSMAVVGLTGNLEANPLAVAEYSAAQGWYVEGHGTDWELMRSGAEQYGLSWEELPLDVGTMCGRLDAGEVIIASMLPGDFTDTGHFIVIAGYDENGFRVLDPNSYTRSGERWSYDTLHGQIGNLWAYWA